jgi:hypothetical protein
MDKDWTFNLNTSFEKCQLSCSNFSQNKWKYVRRREEGRGTSDQLRACLPKAGEMALGSMYKALGTGHKV